MTHRGGTSEARQLRERGLTYEQIAQALGKSTSTIYRWLKPDYAERNRAAARKAKRRRKKATCADCGTKLSYDRQDNERCQLCQHEADYGPRRAELKRRWNADEPAAEIAAALGMSETAVIGYADFRRRRFGEDFKRRQLPRSNAQERYEQIAAWARDGATNAEIAECLGTSPASVCNMKANARKRGIDVPYRRSPA